MLKTLYIFVNGIRSNPGDTSAWTDKAVTWTHHAGDAWGEKFEYRCLALTRRLRQQDRARALAKMISFYKPEEWSIHLVGHSNGCDLICRALRFMQCHHEFRKIDSLHLISAACDADFDENGLNGSIWAYDIPNVFVYCGGKDRALAFAHLSGFLLKPLGLGYGTLGRDGPQRVLARHLHFDHVHTIRVPEFGHSDWFNDTPYGTHPRVGGAAASSNFLDLMHAIRWQKGPLWT